MICGHCYIGQLLQFCRRNTLHLAPRLRPAYSGDRSDTTCIDGADTACTGDRADTTYIDDGAETQHAQVVEQTRHTQMMEQTQHALMGMQQTQHISTSATSIACFSLQNLQ